MNSIADPMIALRGLQQNIKDGTSVDPSFIINGYLPMYDEIHGGPRYSYAKIVRGEVQAVSIFGYEPIGDKVCYNVGYAVCEKFRGQGLAYEAVTRGIEELKKELSRINIKNFYVEAVVSVTNIFSIKGAEKIFSAPGKATVDHYSGIPVLHFIKLIQMS